jgi:hypothetical protein
MKTAQVNALELGCSEAGGDGEIHEVHVAVALERTDLGVGKLEGTVDVF